MTLAMLVLPGTATASTAPVHLILFIHSTTYDPYSVHTVNPVTGQQKTIALGSAAAWSRDGRRIAYVSPNSKIVIRNADGSHVYTGITGWGLSVSSGTLRWSPDGTKIAFIRDGGIWLMNTTAPYHPHQIKPVGFAPSWSPDGTRIAFEEFDGAVENVHVMNADGTGDTYLVHNPTQDQDGPAWSPDGTKIAFYTQHGGQQGIFTVAPDGTGLSFLVHTDVGDPAAWSPDGTQLSYVMLDSQLAVVNADGSGSHVIVSKHNADNPSWAQ